MEITVLEDNLEYEILDTIVIDGVSYVYLIQATDQENNDLKNICIRKIVDNGESLSGLDSEIEFQKALNTFLAKNKNILNLAT